MARLRPTIRGSRNETLPSGASPTPVYASENLLLRAQMARSAAQTSPTPAPAAVR